MYLLPSLSSCHDTDGITANTSSTKTGSFVDLYGQRKQMNQASSQVCTNKQQHEGQGTEKLLGFHAG